MSSDFYKCPKCGCIRTEVLSYDMRVINMKCLDSNCGYTWSVDKRSYKESLRAGREQRR
jgi:translation initiation factor 2 beta subunit (eIF-2beta)/eIF-5